MERSCDGKAVKNTGRVLVKHRTIPADAYPEFRSTIKAAGDYGMQRVVLEARGGIAMRNANRTLILIMLFIGAALLLAAPALAQSNAASPALSGLPSYKTLEARYPGSDGVVLFDSLVITSTAIITSQRAAPGRHALHRQRDQPLRRPEDSLQLRHAGALGHHGARLHARRHDRRHAKERHQSDDALRLDHARYADWQETVVTHVGIEKGCVAELHYRIRDKAPSPWLSGVEIFSSEDPVQVRVLEIEGPGASNLKSASLNGAPAAAKTADGVCWTVRDIAGRTPFDGGAWEGDCFPAVCYSTASGWPDVLPKIGAGIVENPVMRATSRPWSRGDKGPAQRKRKDPRDTSSRPRPVSSVRAPFGLLVAAPRDAQRNTRAPTRAPSTAPSSSWRCSGLPVSSQCPLWFCGKLLGRRDGRPEIFNTVLVAVMAGAGQVLMRLDPASPTSTNRGSALQ